MTLRTPRRRISPRTKRRYRAIKDFLRRALGSSSQPDIKINSSIAINVTDLKHKIVGLEQQLSQVNKHCQGLGCIDNSSRRDSQTLVGTNEDTHDLCSLKEQTEISSIRRPEENETRLLYKTSESHYRKSDDSVAKAFNDTRGKHATSSHMSETKDRKPKKKKSKAKDRSKTQEGSQPNLRRHQSQSAYDNFVASYTTNSYHSLISPRNNHAIDAGGTECNYNKKYKHREYLEGAEKPTKYRKSKDHVKKCTLDGPKESYESKHKNKTKKIWEVDEEFIAEIIKRQYRPMRTFGHKGSDISQFSAPVCRDHDYTVREDILQGSELCSCCVNGRKKSRYKHEHNLTDMHSICDTRLYSSKRQTRHKHRRRHEVHDRLHEDYNDSDLYDLVPVKEKSSPKCRRKVQVDEVPYNYYREVPPSPRTHRPKLNLKAQYYNEFEEYMQHKKNLERGCSPKKHRRIPKQDEAYDSNVPSPRSIYPDLKENPKLQPCKKIEQEVQMQHDAGTMSSLQSPFCNENANVTNDSSLNKTQDSDLSADKADKALCEIKDILQSFLQEIKKETTASQCDTSDITTKTGDKCLNEFRQDSAKMNSSMIPNSGLSVNNFGVSMPSPYMPFTNPCCYPVFPLCPMNCMQSGYVLPNTSFTCTSCVNTKEEDFNKTDNGSKEQANNSNTSNETDELIKEIYKFVAQNPNNARQNHLENKDVSSPRDKSNKKMLTSRSVGESSKMSKHDAKVGTQKINCYSKSCEAIGSRVTTSDTYCSRTNPTYSDTVLERLSLEVSATTSDSETALSTIESIPVKKEKKNKFAKVLRSFGLLKKKKDTIEELSEVESTVEEDVKGHTPFRQDLTNYVMHGQDYYNPPPMPPHGPYPPPQDYRHGYGPNYHPGYMQGPGYETDPYRHPHRNGSPYHTPRGHPTAPPYPNPYDHHHSHPQMPLCLKEIEVKSIATQSDRRKGFFGKFSKKPQGPPVEYRMDDSGARNCSTQTAQQAAQEKSNKFGKFNWKSLQAKVNELDKPDTFSYKTQKKLAEGDLKMRNAMMKKLFYKRNPFSPRNLIVRTLLGKDKSSFGEPPAMYRPRMFV